MSRRPTAEELALWREVARSATRLKPEKKRPEPGPKAVNRPKPPAEPLAPIAPFDIGARASRNGVTHDLLAPVADRVRGAPLAMDRKTFQKMRRGKAEPEARIDLHGMTQAQAHRALMSFVLRARSAGHRLVLVITGKGKPEDAGGPIPQRHGVLRHAVPEWLRSGAMAGVVLQIAQAHPRHGGSGAYYVYLRRNRD